MPLEFWILLWKVVLIVGLGLFATLAVVVTVGGARDVRRLLATLRDEHRQSQETKNVPEKPH
jgi:hypothetical protein